MQDDRGAHALLVGREQRRERLDAARGDAGRAPQREARLRHELERVALRAQERLRLARLARVARAVHEVRRGGQLAEVRDGGHGVVDGEQQRRERELAQRHLEQRLVVRRAGEHRDRALRRELAVRGGGGREVQRRIVPREPVDGLLDLRVPALGMSTAKRLLQRAHVRDCRSSGESGAPV